MASAPLAEDFASDAYPAVVKAAWALGMGPADRVRLEVIALRLRAEGIASDDTRVPLWFAAALCRTAEQRRVFLIECGDEPLPPPPPPPPPGKPRSEDAKAAEDFAKALRRRILLAVELVVLGLLAVFLLLWWFGSPTPITPIVVDNSTAALTTTVTQQIPKTAALPVADWASIAAIVLIALAAFAYWLWRRRRLRDIKANCAPDPDRAVPLALRHEETRLFASRAVRSGLARLRRHRSQSGGRLDVRASIAATIHAGGQPQARFRGRWLLPEYLLLTERESPRDHLALAGQALAERIRNENVAIGHYEFFGSPDRLRAVGGERASTPLASVLARHADARSMLLAESFDLRSSALTPAWVERMTDAGPAVHLNPRLSGGRSEGEGWLAEDGVDSFPLNARGIAAMAQRLADPRGQKGLLASGGTHFDLPRDFDAERKLLLAEEAPRPAIVAGVIEDLTAWLDADGYRWFAALSLFPYLEPALTLYIGSHLKDAAGEPVLTDDRYLALARLPWMRAGSMPRWLRLALAHSLDPDTLASATAAIQAFLLPVVEGGEPQSITIDNGRDPVKRRLLLTWLRESPETEFHDRIMIDMFRGLPAERLGLRPDQALARRLQRLRDDPLIRFYAVVGVTLALVLFVRPPVEEVTRNTGEMETVEYTVDDSDNAIMAADDSATFGNVSSDVAMNTDEVSTDMDFGNTTSTVPSENDVPPPDAPTRQSTKPGKQRPTPRPRPTPTPDPATPDAPNTRGGRTNVPGSPSGAPQSGAFPPAPVADPSQRPPVATGDPAPAFPQPTATPSFDSSGDYETKHGPYLFYLDQDKRVLSSDQLGMLNKQIVTDFNSYNAGSGSRQNEVGDPRILIVTYSNSAKEMSAAVAGIRQNLVNSGIPASAILVENRVLQPTAGISAQGVANPNGRRIEISIIDRMPVMAEHPARAN